MEQQNNAENAAAAPIAGENGTNAAQEVTSTTPSEPTKRSLRVQTWKKIQQNKCGAEYNGIFNRIPSFIDSDKAAALLAETDEFKKAKNIKINIDRALNAAKYQALVANKSLYLPSTRESNALYLHVDVPADSTEEQKKSIINVKDVHEHRSEIALENKVKFDMVIIGSVLVSRDGYRIGRGNGFADLDIGLLIEIGSVTPDTIIATMVHDLQVVDTLPTDLFQKYDAPVDMIITPTEVIRVQKRLPRPAGLFWDLLSERRLKIISVLQVLKEQQEKAGKVITLKQEDTDIEQNPNNRRRRGTMRRRFVRRYPRRAQSQTDTEQQGGGEGGQQQQKRNPRRQRRFVNRRRRQTKSEGDQSAPEKSQDRSQGRGGRQGGQEGGNRDRRQQRQRKNRLNRDFCIKLSNLTRGVRVTDLKTELRKRECKPLFITWKGQYGKCILHFGNRTGVPSTDDDIERVMTALNDLSLTVPVNSGNGNGTGNNNNVENGDGDDVNKIVKTKTVNVNVELIKFDEKKNNEQQQTNGGGNAGAATTVGSGDGGDGDNSARIESVDTTTV